ncbi:MAG: Lon protease family protein [Clostridia bacterium]
MSYEQLNNDISIEQLPFHTTEELDPLYDIIGQERAVNAIEFGLKIKIRGYNIYLSGLTGTGKTSYAETYVKKLAAKENIPDDWCYLYNFDKPAYPIAVNLPAGMGKDFKRDMEQFVSIIKSEIPKAFSSSEYEKEKTMIIKEFQSRRDLLLEQLDGGAIEKGFKVSVTNAGVYFLPIIEGKTLTEEEYAGLEEKEKMIIRERSQKLQLELLDIIRAVKNTEKEAEEKVSEWEHKIALFAVGMHINDLQEKYKNYETVQEYLKKIQDDILDNLGDFIDEEPSEEQSQIVLVPSAAPEEKGLDEKYQVNLIIDNSNIKGAPVIVDFNPSYYNLIGRVEYESEHGSIITNHTMIKPGLLHQANGGYLILQADDLLKNVHSWEALKRALRTKKITIENMQEHLGLAVVSTLRPEAIPLNIKVLMVGNSELYHLLLQHDKDFKKLFKIKADFDEEMEKNTENILKYAQFINSFCKREGVLPFDKTSVVKIIGYSSRLVEDHTKLSTRFNDIVEILAESSAWATIEGSSIVTSRHVDKAVMEKERRSNKYDEKLLKLMDEGTIMVDVTGSVVGQINGLSVLDMGDYSFGKPSRITAATYIGKSGIVNIEREIEMSGTSHSKGVMILSGYIGQKYAQEMPLALTASICFEQLYSGVDGDSASSTELYALLSSLSELPIKQGIAVTGSVNQKGEIQPIGGVNQKIEGFFELCKCKKLTGEQGVMIPFQNIKNLLLKEEVLLAVKNGLFHIYPIKTIDEGIKILTGFEAGVKNQDGKYPKDSVNHRVYEKLKSFAECTAKFNKG